MKNSFLKQAVAPILILFAVMSPSFAQSVSQATSNAAQLKKKLIVLSGEDTWIRIEGT